MGQVRRGSATTIRFHYDSHDQLRPHLSDFIAADNFARRLKTLTGLTPYEYICKIWRSEPGRLILNPIHLMPGLNTQRAPALQRCTIGRPVPGLVARGGGLLMQPSYHAGFTR